MEDGSISQTAIATAMFRAAHVLLDPAPRILDDVYARDFAGFANDDQLRDRFERLPLSVRASRGLFAARSRYVEDEMAEALKGDVTQYVIIGAGLDSYAFRHHDPEKVLRIFEVDAPATQAWKQRRIAELGLGKPERLSFIPADLTAGSLQSAFASSGFRPAERSLFSILGVLQYLTESQVAGLLQDIRKLAAPSSVVVLQYLPPPSAAGEDAETLRRLGAAAAEHGEPWLSAFSRSEIEGHLRAAGFGHASFFDAEAARAHYLADGGGALQIPSYFHMAKAEAV